MTTGLFTLGGLSLGFAVSEITAQMRGRRELARDAKAAARLAGEVFGRHCGLIHDAISQRNWLLLKSGLAALEPWHEHKHVLAGVLERQEWRLLRITVRRLESVVAAGAIRSDAAAPMTDQDVEMLEGAVDYALKCAVMLDSVADHGLFSRKRPRVTAEEVRRGLRTAEDADKIWAQAGDASL